MLAKKPVFAGGGGGMAATRSSMLTTRSLMISTDCLSALISSISGAVAATTLAALLSTDRLSGSLTVTARASPVFSLGGTLAAAASPTVAPDRLPSCTSPTCLSMSEARNSPSLKAMRKSGSSMARMAPSRMLRRWPVLRMTTKSVSTTRIEAISEALTGILIVLLTGFCVAMMRFLLLTYLGHLGECVAVPVTLQRQVHAQLGGRVFKAVPAGLQAGHQGLAVNRVVAQRLGLFLTALH